MTQNPPVNRQPAGAMPSEARPTVQPTPPSAVATTAPAPATRARDGGSHTMRYTLLGLAVAVGALVAVQYPEIQRYLKMRSM